MASASIPVRHRVLVLASLPQVCVCCVGTGFMRNAAGDEVRCPHCITGIPVFHLPMRQDTPRGATA